MKTQINSILIPTDFSELSESALKMGIAIAKRQNAEITLLHVVDKYSYLEPTEVFLPDIRPINDVLSMMEDRIKELSANIQSNTGITVTGKLMDGIPSDQICRCAFDKKIDLIVIGTHGSSGLREFFIGSVAFSVVKHAPCPVLTIPGNWNKPDFEKVLMPIRLMPGAVEKYFFARPIIEKNNSALFILGLSEKKKPGDMKDLAVIVDHLKMQLHHDNIDFQSALCPSDDFSATVIKMAKKLKVDLIVLTANLDYDFKAFFVGPFSQQVINQSNLPVLSVKPAYVQSQPVEVLKLADKWGKSIYFSGFGNPGRV